jgi:hypothetical protein
MEPSTFQYSGGGVRPQGGLPDYGDPTIRYLPSDGASRLVRAFIRVFYIACQLPESNERDPSVSW